MTKRTDHLALLTDRETADLLTTREPAVSLRLSQILPAGEVVTSRPVRSHGTATNLYGIGPTLNHPALRLRHYRGPLVYRGNTLVYSGHTMVSDSNRMYRTRRMGHPVLTEIGAMMARRPPDVQRRLPGSYYLLDPQFWGHFGHIVTEVVPRLWAWDEAKAADPDLKALYLAPPGQEFDPVIRTFLTAYGIAEADQVAVQEPVRLDAVACAAALWHGSNAPPHFVHPRLLDVWERLAASLVDSAGLSAAPEKIFVARPATSPLRVCRNADEVEDLFAAHGFTVVHPEHLDIPAQATLFREARVIAGFAGSGMFNAMYAHRLEHLVVLAPQSYLARHENKYAVIRGAGIDYFWSPSDRTHANGVDMKAFNSAWEFDFATHRETLEALLREL